MLPVKRVRLLIGTLLAANAGSLAPPADPNVVALCKNPSLGESENIVIGDVVLADFDGSTPIPGVIGAQQVANDIHTGDQVVTIKDPAGGYRWVSTGLTNLPQTIYGAVLLNNAMTEVLGVEVFPQPVTVTEVGQEINLGRVVMTVVAQPVE